MTDNGTPVKLSSFRLVTDDANADHLITMVFDRFQGPTAKSAQSLALKMLKMIPSKDYAIAVLDFNGRLRLIQGFTYDRGLVEQAVRAVTERSDKKGTPLELEASNMTLKGTEAKADEEKNSLAAQAAERAEKNLIAIARTGADTSGNHVDVKERARYRTLLAALSDAQRVVQDQHARPNLAGLLALVRSQQNVADRKALIYFTQNTQMDLPAKEMVKTITGAATRSGVSVYAVDMNAMDTGTEHQIQTAMTSGGAPFNPTPQPVPGSGGLATTIPMQQAGGSYAPGATGSASDFMMRSDEYNTFASKVKSPMADLASGTGGVYIDAQNNVNKPLQQMLQSLSTYYEATYAPPIREYDGKFRTIAIKSERPGLNVQTKTGYFALAPGAAGGIRPFEVPLMKILSEPQLPTDIMFHAAVVRSGDLPDGNESTLAVEVPLSELQTKEDTHTNLATAHVSIVAEIKDKSGTVVEHFGEDVSQRSALGAGGNTGNAVISMQRHFMSLPGHYVLEVAVLDQLSSKSSAKRQEFDIVDDSNGPSLSDMVLVRKMDTVDEESDPTEPLRYENAKVTPNLSGLVPREAKSVSMFVILHPDAKASDAPTLEMQVIHNGKAGRRVPLPLKKGDAGAALPYLATFPSKLSPGFYQVKATMTQSGKTMEQQIAFTVEGDGTTVAASAPEGHGGAEEIESATEADAHLGGQLAITSPSQAIPPPTPEEVQAIIADARARAVNYAESLPNFLCVEVTDRSVDVQGTGQWKHRDTITELLRFVDKNETRTTLEVNGQAADAGRDALLVKRSVLSTGELGGVLKAAFDPTAKAEFQYKETDGLESGTVQVFSYRVAQPNSMFAVGGMNNLEIKVGFHGLVFIDSATHSVRRITLIADDIPKDFPTHGTAMAVDYDYVVINTHDYLVPVSAEVNLHQGKREAVLNTIEFRNYRRFGSNVRILEGAQEQHP